MKTIRHKSGAVYTDIIDQKRTETGEAIYFSESCGWMDKYGNYVDSDEELEFQAMAEEAHFKRAPEQFFPNRY